MKETQFKITCSYKMCQIHELRKKRLIFKAFIVSQFNYFPLLWMIHTKQLNNRINSLHEKALRVTFQNRNSSFSKLLKLEKLASIHCRYIKYLLTEIYKVKMGLSPPVMSDIFSLNQNSSYNITSGVSMSKRNVRTSKLVLRLLIQFGAILWNDLPAELKHMESLNTF